MSATFQTTKRVRSNAFPRGPQPLLPAPAVGRLKPVPFDATGTAPVPAAAPVCPDNVYRQPAFWPVELQRPPIPVALPTLPSVVQVLNQIVQNFNTLITHPLGLGNGASLPGAPGAILILGVGQVGAKAAAHTNATGGAKGKWVEVARNTEDVRVENPDDSDQYVIVRRINLLKMRNTTTGEEWTFDRGSAGGG
jgi:hypothetical protein